ncbi:2'-5' RNA ligase family protein [Paenibacillus sp. UMB7766-LJ446]|uniref:2'-5' RNA ligase family protein n=1 Tax=Paenibacillus sp. UMB7766-LJ446 TaxID=3046313 RepID=UPI00254DF752|nr:2'-5' RNA ligase family protein [Paenibacillus sp. UMB7766-LJ446]MDK8189880.1 2'-5' RNA ligase family protein [Paenibacillus sp. UMB7766-LJ446]
MFAVVAHFDQKTEQAINTIWKGLSASSISDYAYEISGRKPHITIADYSDIDEKFLLAFKSLYGSKVKIQVVFNALSTFLNTGSLMLTPAPSKQLIDLHTEHHTKFREYSNPQSFYLPNGWTPHCTIANRLSQTGLNAGLDYCSKHLVTLHSEIVEIAVIKITFDKNKAVGVSIISNEILR